MHIHLRHVTGQIESGAHSKGPERCSVPLPSQEGHSLPHRALASRDPLVHPNFLLLGFSFRISSFTSEGLTQMDRQGFHCSNAHVSFDGDQGCKGNFFCPVSAWEVDSDWKSPAVSIWIKEQGRTSCRWSGDLSRTEPCPGDT